MQMKGQDPGTARAHAAETGRDGGFTLVEMVVVMIVVGILAAVAIPFFITRRENAWQKSVDSDARNAATLVEDYYTANRTYDIDPDDRASFEAALAVSAGDTVSVYSAAASFCISVSGNGRNAYATGTSGGIQEGEPPADSLCATTDAVASRTNP